jgi:LacI family transcriptional regulator, galactose operon repressor
MSSAERHSTVATIRDVATLARVSTATVSHVLNETRPVSEVLRDRVQIAMKQLSYQPDAVARSLRCRETLTLGLFVPSLEIPFYAWIADSIEAAAHTAGYNIILCSAGWSLARELAAIDELMARRVDGMVCISIAARAEHVWPVLRRGTPVVWLERTMPGIELDAVFVDNFKGAYDATRHLIELGHKQIGCIMGLVDSQLSDERVVGYRQALADGGLPFEPGLLQRGDYMPPSGYAGAEALLARPNRPTAIFAFNDLMAMGALQAIHRLGLRVPDDIAVIGFDGVPLAEHTSPPLSTIEQPVPAMSENVIKLLLDRINDDAPKQGRTVVVEPRLIVRASTVGYDE